MTFSPNIYSGILILCGLITLYMCIRIFRRYVIVVRWFGFMMLGIAIWALSYGLELSSTTREQMLFWLRIEYLGISFFPAFWVLFIIKFTGKDKWLNMRSFILIFLIPFITLLMVWTNELHHLHYKGVSLDESGMIPLLNIVTGPWYIIHTAYFYAMLGWGVMVLFFKYKKADPLFKKQKLIILIATFIPWITNIVYMLGYRPLGHIDSTPFAFSASVLMVSVGLVRFRLLDIIPIAREKVLETMNEGLIVTDSRERIVDLNGAIKRILAIEDKNIIGRDLGLILPEQTELNALIKKRISGQVHINMQMYGSVKSLEINLTPLFEKHIIYSGLIILVRDITERILIEEQLRIQSADLWTLNKLKDRLFSIISHDLRGPLNSINEIMKLLNEGILSEDEFRSVVPRLSKNIGYASGLLENLLFWSKSQLHGEVVKPVHFKVKEVAESILSLYESVINEKELRVVNNIDADCIVYADKDMIQLIIRNLISNAVKFCKRGANITLSSQTDGNTSIISFTDTGIGISESDIKKLFEMDTFTTRGTDNERGTGIGLLLCKDFIEKNRGKIWATSELSTGSKFYFQIQNSAEPSHLLAVHKAELNIS